jgi:hypothetical protein
MKINLPHLSPLYTVIDWATVAVLREAPERLPFQGTENDHNSSIPASVCIVPNQPGGRLHYNLRLSAFEFSGC